MTDAINDIATERQRQIESEGWTPEHDDEHGNGDLAKAAACYANPRRYPDPRITTPLDWPWDGSWWKPDGGRRRQLVKAAALIVAEIERLDRSNP